MIGHSTASGEKLHRKSRTAAHRTLPFGTILKVTNLVNGKMVNVRINDRGPYSKKRILDVSYPAAVDLGMVSDGTTKIKIEVIGYDTRTAEEIMRHELDSLQHGKEVSEVILHDTSITSVFENQIKNPIQAKGYGIQVGIFKDKQKAEILYGKLIAKGFTKLVLETPSLDNQTLYRIIVGEYENKQVALEDIKKLKEAGFETYFKRYNY